MSKKDYLELKDSAVPVWNVGLPSITVNFLNDGAIERLKELVKAKFISFAKPVVEESSINQEKRFLGMNKPVRLGFDLKKISRDELYER
jgi:hypothetical protein